MTDEPRMTAEDAYEALAGMDEFTTEQAVSALQDREEEIRGRSALGFVIDESVHFVGDAAFDGGSAGRGRPVKPRRKPESEVVAEAISYLRSILRGYARKVHGGAMGNAGEPDVDACVRGRSCKFEAKAGAEKPSQVQLASLRRWAKAGALVGWFRNNTELRQLLDHLEDSDYETDLSAPGCSQPCHREAA